MKTMGFVALIVAFVCSSGADRAGTPAPSVPDSSDCQISQSINGVENDALKAFPPPDGRFIFKPGGPGFVDHDGALGIKFAWVRLKNGRLHVGGRRLDGEAAPARAYISDYGDIGFQPIYLLFPMPGCWEITGGLGDATLTFVVFVEKIGDGPSWRMQGPQRGWPLTTRWGV